MSEPKGDADSFRAAREGLLAGMLTFWLFAWPGAVMAATSTVGVRQPLSLDHAIQLALQHNPDIKSAQNALRSTEAARRATAGRLYPQIQALSWYQIFPTKRGQLIPGAYFAGVTNQANVFQDQIFNIGLGLDWTLYAGGRLRAAEQGAGSQAMATSYRLERTRQQLMFAVIQTYLGIGVAERSERAVQASIKYLTEAKLNLQEFVKVGKKPRLDLLRVESRLEQTQQLLADTQVALVTLRANLRRLLGLDKPFITDKNVTLETVSALPSMTVALEKALAERPDYLELESEVQAQGAQLRIAEGARLPKIDLSARVWVAHGNRTGGAIRSYESDSEIRLSLSVPLFTGGTLNANVDREQARSNQSEDRLSSLGQQIRQDVVQSYAQLHAAHAKVLAAKAGVNRADEAFRIQRQKSAVGVGTVTDLLDIQAADLSAQTAYYQAQAGVSVARARILLAIGVLKRAAIRVVTFKPKASAF